MGLDFMERAAPRFRKAVSRDAEAMARMAACVSSAGHKRIVLADCVADRLSVGQLLIIRCVADELLLIDGLHDVGRVRKAPADVLRRLVELGGFGEGRVEHVNSMGGTCDVALL